MPNPRWQPGGSGRVIACCIVARSPTGVRQLSPPPELHASFAVTLGIADNARGSLLGRGSLGAGGRPWTGDREGIVEYVANCIRDGVSGVNGRERCDDRRPVAE